MGNKHRVPALVTAFVSTVGLILSIYSGLSCRFLHVKTTEGSLLLTSNEVELAAISASIGILCDEGFYDRSGDFMWEMSRVFLVVCLTLGSLTTVLAWAVSTFLPPTNTNWRFLSMISALTAVLQVPIFLVFEAEPCSLYQDRQTCQMGFGSLLLILSTTLFIVVTLITQLLDPPLWAIELSTWRLPLSPKRQIRTGADPELGGHYRITGIYPDSPQKGNSRGMFQQRSLQTKVGLRTTSTESIPLDDFQEPLMESEIKPGECIDQTLILRVLPSGRLPGDEQKSVASFEDLEEIVRLAEEGQLGTFVKPDDNLTVIPIKSILPADKHTKSKDLSLGANKTPWNRPTVKAEMLSGDAILMDLESNEVDPILTGKSSGGIPLLQSDGERKRTQIKKNHERFTIGTIKKKINGDLKKRRARRRHRNGRRAYHQIADTYDSDDSDVFVSPPIEVKIPQNPVDATEASDSDNDNALENDFFQQQDVQSELAEDWETKRQATSAGAWVGPREGTYTEEEIAELHSLSTYHSDPEPAFYSTDENDGAPSLPSMNRTLPTDSNDETSTVSTASGSGGSPRHTMSRGRHHRQISEIVSLKSGGSLMGTTINEETEKDIIEEIAAEENELNTAYSLSRTMSAPESRGRSLDRSRRLDRRSWSRPSRGSSGSSYTRIEERENENEQCVALDTNGQSTAEPTRAESPTAPTESRAPDYTLQEAHEADAAVTPRHTTLFKPASTKRPKHARSKTRSLSPFASAMHERQVTSRYNKEQSSTCSNLSRQARVIRLRRLHRTQGQGVKISVDASTTSAIREAEKENQPNRRHQKSAIKADNQSDDDSYVDDNAQLPEEHHLRSVDLFHPEKSRAVDLGVGVVHTVSQERTSTLDRAREVRIQRLRRENEQVTSPEGSGLTLLSTPKRRHVNMSQKRVAPFSPAGEDDLPVDTKAILDTLTDSTSPPRQPFLDGTLTPTRAVARLISYEEADDEAYDNAAMDELDLQLIEVRRPVGLEYGDDEGSL